MNFRKYSLVLLCALSVFTAQFVPNTALAQSDTKDFTFYFEKYLGYYPDGKEAMPLPIDLNLPNLHIHSAPTFMPDGKEFYFSAYYKHPNGNRNQDIFIVKFENGAWQKPVTAKFSGTYSEGGPFISPDGTMMIFNSNRPRTPDGKPSDLYVPDLWYMERNGDLWGDPVNIGFDWGKSESFASISAEGGLYFSADFPGNTGPFDIVVSRLENGRKFSAPARLANSINNGFIKTTPYIAPDESFLLFAYANTPGKNGINISIKEKTGKWGTPLKLDSKVNSRSSQRFPGMSPDGKFLFFYSNKKLYWINADFIYKIVRNKK